MSLIKPEKTDARAGFRARPIQEPKKLLRDNEQLSTDGYVVDADTHSRAKSLTHRARRLRATLAEKARVGGESFPEFWAGKKVCGRLLDKSTYVRTMVF